MPTDAYTECLDAMYRMRRFGIILGLSTITNILSGLGNPQHTFSAIHIAGTNAARIRSLPPWQQSCGLPDTVSGFTPHPT